MFTLEIPLIETPDSMKALQLLFLNGSKTLCH